MNLFTSSCLININLISCSWLFYISYLYPSTLVVTTYSSILYYCTYICTLYSVQCTSERACSKSCHLSSILLYSRVSAPAMHYFPTSYKIYFIQAQQESCMAHSMKDAVHGVLIILGPVILSFALPKTTPTTFAFSSILLAIVRMGL